VVHTKGRFSTELTGSRYVLRAEKTDDYQVSSK